MTLTDLRGEEEVREEFHYENGVQDFVSYLNEDKETLTPVSILMEISKNFTWN